MKHINSFQLFQVNALNIEKWQLHTIPQTAKLYGLYELEMLISRIKMKSFVETFSQSQ